MKNIAVVILNHNGRHFLEKFLRNTIEKSPEADVVVIDNGSTDDSYEYLTHNFPEITTIGLPKNLGYAAGYNQGLADLEHDYFILLNSDVEVSRFWIQPMLETALKNRNIAAIQPKILDYNQRGRFEYAGAAGGHLDVLGYPFCKGRIFETLESDKGQYSKAEPIFWATGACLFVRREIFYGLKGFDESFFAHMEEIDLCWRLHDKGFDVYYQPDSSVYHIGAGTLASTNPFKTFLNYRNSLAMLYKNMPSGLLFPILFARLILDGISGIRFLFKFEFKNLWAIIKAHFSFYKMIPDLKKKRSNSTVGFKKLYNGSIVWSYFVRRKKTYTEICLK